MHNPRPGARPTQPKRAALDGLVDGLRRAANIASNDPTQAKGRFVAALNQDELLSGFLDVAGFIGRIVE